MQVKNSANRKLTSDDKLTVAITEKGVETWDELLALVKSLPYGRNANRTDFGLVISEQKGTCSSKHALLKKIADLNHIPNVKLVLGIYKMDKINTPGIGNYLIESNIEYIPEAHCYLNIDGEIHDVTTTQSDFENLKKDIVHELEIQPELVGEFKVEYHKAYLKNWILERGITMTFDELWNIRENCIAHLSKSATGNQK